MKLTTANLQRLAELYMATPSQLLADPEASELVATLDRVQTIIERMKPEALDSWLNIGEQLARETQTSNA